MAHALQCDRCGKFYTISFTSELRVQRYVHCYGDKWIDLCDDCEEDLKKFLNNEDIKGRTNNG